MSNQELHKISEQVWEISKSGSMRVPGRIFASDKLMQSIRSDESLKQVANVAQLPGIIGYSFAMPDIHWGYGFPIGGVAAFDIEEGIISPGGVGYDINCGVRLMRTNLTLADLKKSVKDLIAGIFSNVPSGIGSHGAIRKLSRRDLEQVALEGASWAVKNGFGDSADLEYIEDRGQLAGGDPSIISQRAFERGADQVGTLGSGNHFIEIGKVADIFDQVAADTMGIFKDKLVIILHTGSRGFGYQICDDFIKTTLNATRKYEIQIPDRQLACAPLKSPEGRDYLAAMRSAANFAFANRQVIASLIENSMMKTLGISPSEIGFRPVWDIAHNIAKIEEHQFGTKNTRVCVHRKGATRAFGPDHPDLPEVYRKIGQPVLIPGDMGTESFLCVGTTIAMQETFGSACHGAGRVLSRHQAKAKARGIDLYKTLAESGVYVMAEQKGTIAEEMPFAYKDVSEVVETMNAAGIIRKVARFKPLGVIKG
ncbi:MAG: RtcB family protein [Candidatus Neomarinimicrobiota bacterium]